MNLQEKKKFNRIFTIVVDSWGFGSAPDSDQYGDEGADTVGHIAESVDSLSLPVMQRMGLFRLNRTVRLRVIPLLRTVVLSILVLVLYR